MKRSRGPVIVGLTLGDPAGIGPEIAARTLEHYRTDHRVSLRLIGRSGGVRPGRTSKTGARAAWEALEESADLVLSGAIDAVVNGPVHKGALVSVGFPYPGQTEFYAARAGVGTGNVTMMMAGPRLKVALATTHCSLRQAVRKLDVPTIVRTGLRTASALRAMGVSRPRIAVCGLNPHAGEAGIFGDEEIRLIAPAVRQLVRSRTARYSGPHVPDVVFRQAAAGEFDAVVCMYHDQGLIPLKLLDFDHAVNVTLGLPFWRCSPDHGTALDIAGKNRASAASMIEAVALAVRLSSGRVA